MHIKKIKKAVRILDRAEDIVLFLLCAMWFLIGIYAMADSYLVYRHANDESLLKYKPGYETNSQSTKEIKGNMAAWLTVDDTNIDYPVMQGKDNEEFLNKDPYGDYSLSGSIFLDCRNNADFTDSYSLIYGHHMEGNYMFGAINSFLKEKFFEEHKTGKLIVNDTEYDLKIFAAMDTEATQDIIFSPTEFELSDVLKYIKENSKYYREDMTKDLTEESRIVARSTCKYPESVYRVVAFAVMEIHTR